MSATVKVWDPFVRIFHWSLVSSFAVAWVSADDWSELHEWAGYAAAALVSARLLWGLFGARYAKFTQFVQSPMAVSRYLWAVIQGREKRYLGHNPAGGAMIVLLMATMAGLCASGYLYTTDTFWGVAWVEALHETLANLLLGLVILHVAGVVWASVKHRENLVRAMLTGRKRAADLPDVS